MLEFIGVIILFIITLLFGFRSKGSSGDTMRVLHVPPPVPPLVDTAVRIPVTVDVPNIDTTRTQLWAPLGNTIETSTGIRKPFKLKPQKKILFPDYASTIVVRKAKTRKKVRFGDKRAERVYGKKYGKTVDMVGNTWNSKTNGVC